MAQYLLSVHMVEGEPMPAPDVLQEMFTAVEAFNADLRATGAWVFAGGLQETDIATVVGIDGTMTDGPFAEAKEHLGGFWVVECPDLDAALELARRGAAACQGPVEVRPFQVEPEG